MKFRRLLERNKLGEALFAQVGAVLQARGVKVGTGTIVDATIISAPSSTKNADKLRDPEMHQTRKGQQWFFGMKLHIGVDAQTGLAHSAVVTAANVHDKHPLPDLLHGQEKQVWGVCAYAGQHGLFYGWINTIFQHRLSAADFLQCSFSALVIELLEAVEAVPAEPHDFAGLGHTLELLG